AESLNVSARCGLRPNARQIRPTVDCDSPLAWAMPRVLQWVAWDGLVSRVRVTTFSTASSVTVRGAPGLGSSASPSNRPAPGRPLQPAGHEPAGPGADGGTANAQLLGHDLVGGPRGTGQDDPGAKGEALGTLGPVGPAGERLALVVGQRQLGFRACHTASVFS